MITFFVGTPGSGKSYEAVKKVVDNLRLGRVVCTNIEGMDNKINQEYLKNLLGFDDFQFHTKFRFLSQADTMRFWKKEKIIELTRRYDDVSDTFQEIPLEFEEHICPLGSLIILDEVHKHFNSRDWQSSANRELADWASTHRHDGYDVILITQKIDKVDKQTRSLAEFSYFFRKVNFFGGLVSSKYMKYGYTGDEDDGKPVTTSTHSYDTKYFPCYQSYNAANTKEVGFMTHVNILKHPIFLVIPVLIAFTMFMFFKKSSFASGDILGTKKIQEKHNQKVSAAPAPGQPIMKNISASRAHLVIPASVSLPAIPADAFARFPVSGSLQIDGKTFIMLNGFNVKLPSPSVRAYYPELKIAVASTEVFGPPVSPSGHAPLSDPAPAFAPAPVKLSAAAVPVHPLSSIPR